MFYLKVITPKMWKLSRFSTFLLYYRWKTICFGNIFCQTLIFDVFSVPPLFSPPLTWKPGSLFKQRVLWWVLEINQPLKFLFSRQYIQIYPRYFLLGIHIKHPANLRCNFVPGSPADSNGFSRTPTNFVPYGTGNNRDFFLIFWIFQNILPTERCKLGNSKVKTFKRRICRAWHDAPTS